MQLVDVVAGEVAAGHDCAAALRKRLLSSSGGSRGCVYCFGLWT